jgi:hypothetical protein
MWRALAVSLGLAATGLLAQAGPDHGVPPVDEWTCPRSHPIKASFRPVTRQCVYHVPGGPHYRAARPDICFATEEAARREDCWRAEEVL